MCGVGTILGTILGTIQIQPEHLLAHTQPPPAWRKQRAQTQTQRKQLRLERLERLERLYS